MVLKKNYVCNKTIQIIKGPYLINFVTFIYKFFFSIKTSEILEEFYKKKDFFQEQNNKFNFFAILKHVSYHNTQLFFITYKSCKIVKHVWLFYDS